jgi:putative PIN family toxin of toxin-antitoxin system
VTVVIDTNVVPGIFRAGHPHGALLDGWFEGHFSWAVTTEILLEYSEVIGRMSGTERAGTILDLIESVGAVEGNLLRIAPHFRFHAIPADPDDDKFADCTIVAEADYVITEDRHFDVLTGTGYKPQPISPAEFIRRFLP